MKQDRISFPLAAALFGFLGALWLSPVLLDPAGVPFWRAAKFSDLLISHWPNAVFLNRAVRAWHQIPLWNPTILSGYPFFADPLAGVWYPPLWFAAAFPSALTFNLLIWLHLAWAGLGMWRLARSEGLSDFAALISGVVFAGAPKWIAHIGLGHIGLVCAVSWTPWLLLGVRNALEALYQGREGWLRALSTNGLLLAVVFLADPRWLLPCLILVAFFVFHRLSGFGYDLRSKFSMLVRWAGVTGIFALGTAAGFATAFVLFVSRSTRTLIDAAAPDPFALRLAELGDLLAFNPGQPEKFIYLGLGVAFLTIMGILFDERRSWFWYATAILGVLLSLGANLPWLGPLLHSLPLASLLRVPTRWFFITILAAAYFSGAGFETMLKAPIRKREFSLSFLIFGLLAVGAYSLTVRSRSGSLDEFGLLFVPAAAIIPLILFRRFGWLHQRTFMLAAIAVLSIESGLIANLVLEMRPAPVPIVVDDGMPFGEKSSVQGRVFSPSYSIDQLSAAQAGLELASGVHPLPLKTYWVYMARATGFDPDVYSVTLPPFPSGNPETPWPMDLDLDALDRLNIEMIVSAYPVTAGGLSPVQHEDGRYVYRLDDRTNGAWVEPLPAGSAERHEAQVAYRSPNRIELIASGPGKLVISEIAYPGWRVRVDGQPAVTVVVDGLLRGVQLEAGEHRVTFEYIPTHLYIGTALTVMTLIAAFYIQVRR
ncbi:MAG: YfhO family protein [Anaerolineales bacterium]|jgi:hypothetical protein